MNEKFTKERVFEAYNAAPDFVRNSFNSEATTQAIIDIMSTYKLHVDTAGMLGKQVGYMLLGLMSPAEFFGTLVLSGTDENTARQVMEELNKKVFIPLNEKMKGEEASPSPKAPLVPPMAVTAAAPTAPAIPAPQPMSQFAAEPVVIAPPLIAPPIPTPTRIPPPPPVNLPGMPAAAPVYPEAAMPAMTAPAGPAPVMPESQPAAAPTSQKPPIVREYGTDPYREPME